MGAYGDMLLQMNMEEDEPSAEEVMKSFRSVEKVCSYYQRRELARLMAQHCLENVAEKYEAVSDKVK